MEMLSASRSFVIVGAGQAGAWIARTLRAEGFDGRIVLIGREPHLPYERPPLSKDVLRGKAGADTARLLSPEAAEANRIEVWTGTLATEIDRRQRIVRCADGGSVSYDHLFLTTGSRVRTLPFSQPDSSPKRVHVLRGLDDAEALRQAMSKAGRLAIVGGGWIGLEVAATARQLGLEVVVIEAAPLLCSRSLPPEVSIYLEQLHRSHGVEVRTGTAVDSLEVEGEAVRIRSGVEHILVDHVLVGIGVIPETELAAKAGLPVDNGILVDECGRTADPLISAAGDVTSHPSALSGGRVRLESWANAQNQAIVAAKAALGMAVRHAEIPWFWSDQYDTNIQIIGTPERAASQLVRGDPAAGKGCWISLSEAGGAVGAVAVNAPRELRSVRKALEQQLTPEPASNPPPRASGCGS